MIVAIDGPAASGKGTLARKLAAHFGLPHLDTGLLYRATARALMDECRDFGDPEAAVAAAPLGSTQTATVSPSLMVRLEIVTAAFGVHSSHANSSKGPKPQPPSDPVQLFEDTPA